MTDSVQGALARLEPFAAGVIAQQANNIDGSAVFPTHTVDALRQANLLGLITPTEHGGLGGTIFDAAKVVERIAQECGTSAMVACMHYSGAAVLAAFGSAEANAAVARGEHLSTLAFSESGSRSHFWAPVSTAKRSDGDSVTLDARKSWVTSASHAHAYIWSSQSLDDPAASTIWLVERGQAGLSISGGFDGLGLRGNDSTPVSAEGVRIPLANRLGPEGGGFDVMMGTVLPAFQLMNAACSIGLMEGALRGAIAHVSATRLEHMGTSLRELPTLRSYLAQSRIQADSARALWLDTMAAAGSNRPDTMLRILQVKAAANEAALDVTATCMRVCGGAAYRKDLGVDRYFRDAQAGAVMAPTSDVLYDFVGKAICGMELF